MQYKVFSRLSFTRLGIADVPLHDRCQICDRYIPDDRKGCTVKYCSKKCANEASHRAAKARRLAKIKA